MTGDVCVRFVVPGAVWFGTGVAVGIAILNTIVQFLVVITPTVANVNCL